MDNCIWSWLRHFSIAFQLSLGGDIEKHCDFQIEAHQIYDFASILKEVSLQTVDDKAKHTIECDLFTNIYWEDSDYGWLHFASTFRVENALNFSNQYQHLLGWKHCPKFENKPEMDLWQAWSLNQIFNTPKVRRIIADSEQSINIESAIAAPSAHVPRRELPCA